MENKKAQKAFFIAFFAFVFTLGVYTGTRIVLAAPSCNDPTKCNVAPPITVNGGVLNPDVAVQSKETTTGSNFLFFKARDPSKNTIIQFGNGGNLFFQNAGGAEVFNIDSNSNIRLNRLGNPAEGSIFGLDRLIGYNDLRFYADNTGTTELMRINADGKVGIGTITPGYKLDVNGTANISGTLTVGGQAVFNDPVADNASPFITLQGGGGCSKTVGLNFSPFSGHSPGYSAQIIAKDDCAGSADLIFATAPSATSAAVERMRIKNNGAVQLKNGLEVANTVNVATFYADSTGFGQINGGNNAWWDSSNGRFAMFGNSSMGVVEASNAATNGVGVNGSGQLYGVFGSSTSYGVYGYANSSTAYGVYCFAPGGSNKCGGTKSWTVVSDARLKNDIQTIPNSIDKIMALRGVSFKFNKDASGRRNLGFIAQEVMNVLPEAVTKDNTGYYTMTYDSVVPVLVEAVKELKAQNDQLKARIDALEKKRN